MAQKKTINSLQGLRAIMMGIVVVFHVFGINIIYGGGAEAMPFFFILSGFVLSLAHHNKKELLTFQTEIGFLKKRICKIYPLYFFVITVFLLFLLFVSWIEKTDPKLKNRLVYYFVNAVMMESWVDYDGITAGFGGGTWFISSLVFCYLIFLPLKAALGKIKNRKPNAMPVLFVGLLVVIGLYQFIFKRLTTTDSFYFTYFFPIYRALEFVLGIVLAQLFLAKGDQDGDKGKIKYTIFEVLIGLYFIAERIALRYIPLQEKYDWRVCMVEIMVICAMIYVFAFQKGLLSKLISLKPFLWFASISFEVYLLHQPVQNILGKLLGYLGVHAFRGFLVIGVTMILAAGWNFGAQRLRYRKKKC